MAIVCTLSSSVSLVAGASSSLSGFNSSGTFGLAPCSSFVVGETPKSVLERVDFSLALVMVKGSKVPGARGAAAGKQWRSRNRSRLSRSYVYARGAKKGEDAARQCC
jgi:hypothetical protein